MFSLYCETLPALEFSPGVGKNRRIIFSLNFKSIGRFLYEPRGNAVFLGASLRRPCTLPVLPALKNRCKSMRIFPPITGASISVSTQPTSCSVGSADPGAIYENLTPTAIPRSSRTTSPPFSGRNCTATITDAHN